MSGVRRIHVGHARRNERGQAVVEFALILPVFIILVAGLIKFGIALNFWLDTQRIANEGARWAVVNRYPLPNGSSCSGANPCNPTLQQVMGQARLAKGENTTPCITFPANSGPADSTGNATPQVGDPVTVDITRKFSLGIPFLPLSVNIDGAATMRIEQAPTVYAAGC